MTITSSQWTDYINKLSTLNSRGSKLVQDWIDKHGTEDVDALIDYCYKVVARYGTASAELTASMYEAIAQAEEVFIQPAELAEIASYGDAAKAVQGSLLQSPSGQLVKQAVSRQIKLASADTLAKNALRDGAEWAWIPSGDTCPFCLMLASQGWVKASQKALKNGHCKHIHANCDCTYAVRFDSSTTVAGYDPDRYLADYEGAEGKKPREKLNAMRRERYEANKGKINAQKRAAYAKKTAAAPFLNFREKYAATSAKDILPRSEHAIVSTEKIKGYVLNTKHPIGGHKAVVFRDVLGYTEENSDALIAEIKHELPNWKAKARDATRYGQPYEVRMLLKGPTGRTAVVKTGWIIDDGSEDPRLVSAYIYKEKG